MIQSNKKKFNKLIMENKPKQDPEKAIFNFSKVSLSGVENPLLLIFQFLFTAYTAQII